MERFLLPSLESVMDSKIKDSEGRIRNVEFKMATQIAQLTLLLAEYLEYSDEDLERLRADAIRHLKETNGSCYNIFAIRSTSTRCTRQVLIPKL